ncbi:MAG TPA: hypothetical protein VM100_07100 [Longimicrobiales bacterium]|nr:hypothetical protein [Longimicrobiales bacterium]
MSKALAVIALCLIATACRGQAPQRQSKVDPALTALVDTLLPKLEVLSGLKKLKPVALAEQSREDLRKYIESRLNEEMPPKELEGIRQTYVALGLIPDTLNMRAMLLDLYQEQVAGYYDPKTDKFYLIQGTPIALLRPVLAHELVHALQDQHQNLDSLISRSRGNDRQSAAQAAIEGHATVVMFALMLQEASGQPIMPNALPNLSAQLQPALDAQNSAYPVFKNAPRIFRETMVFPYLAGAGFVQKLWNAKATDSYIAPLDSLLPQSTEQVLHTQTHFLAERDEPTEVRFSNTANVLYENTLGEMEMGILLSQHLGLKSNDAAAGWDGDRYQLIEVKGNQVLVWQSIWDSSLYADKFKNNYELIGRKRKTRAVQVIRNKVEGREGVLVIDADNSIDPSAWSGYTRQTIRLVK